MSKTNKKKNTETGKSSDPRPNSTSVKDYVSSGVKRQSVFDRLGTKTTSSGSPSERSLSINTSASSDSFCRNWAQNGTCPYGKTCNLVQTHALISPSKRNSSNRKDNEVLNSPVVIPRRLLEEEKNRGPSGVKRQSPPQEGTLENWDQTELEYEDEKVLEKRRAALQRELELQMKKDGNKKELVKFQPPRSSSTSSRSSSSSVSSSTSTSSRSSASASKKPEARKRRPSTSSPEPDKKKLAMKSGGHKDSPSRKMSSSGARDVERSKGRGSGGGSPLRTIPSRKRSLSPIRKPSPKSKSSTATNDPYKGITLEVTLKNDLALRGSNSRRKDSPLRRGGSSDRRSRRSSSRSRRRSPAPRLPSTRRSRPRSPSRPTTSRARTPERKKDDDRRKDDRRGRRGDYREKKGSHDDARGRVKARELREVAREKERLEALERCRERQREREQKEKERIREDRERKDPKRSGRGISRGSTASTDKRHDRNYDRFDRSKGGERDRSYERDRVRERPLDRLIDRKSVERIRERSRDRYSDRANYSDSRRLLPADEKTYSSSPYRGSDRSRFEGDRERISPREVRTGYSDDRRDRGRTRGWAAESQQPPQPSSRYEEPSREREKPRSSAGADWTAERGSEFPESSSTRSREWDSSRVRDDRGDDWTGYERGTPADWHTNRPHGHHIIDERERRPASEAKEKDVHHPADPVKEKEPDHLGKRSAVPDEPETAKKPRLSEPPPLEELSDISDGPDDILNQDDIESTEGEDSRLGTSSQAAVCEIPCGERTEGLLDDSLQPSSPTNRTGDEETMVDLDFEEISDEELEEESKLNKGDALGVDWASLMAECRPQKKKPDETTASSVRVKWEPSGILRQMGVSSTLASPQYLEKLKLKFPQVFPHDQTQSRESGISVAALHRKLAEGKIRRDNLIALSMENKQALSARADIAIRRRLCGLPVISLETHTTTGFCPWAV